MASRIGRYTIVRELGRGGMGVVLLAHDPQLQRHVAIKMVAAAPGGDGGEELARFQREARAAARLRHPAIVGVHEVAADEAGRPFIVMDYVEGRPLSDALDAGLPPRHAAEILAEVAAALEHAHGAGIVHRDVKPANVLLDANGRPHLTDFGLARELGDGEQLTRTGQVLGTPGYMAPEQADGDSGAIGPATDVWGLGAVLYRAIAGRAPFAASSTAEILKQILFDDPTPPRQLVPSAHRDLETIALRCLEKEPDRRYGSAALVEAELRRFVAGEAIHARAPGRRERAARWVRRNRLAAGALGLVILLTIVATGIGVTAVLETRRASQRGAETARAEARAAATDLARETAAQLEDVVRDSGADASDALRSGIEALQAAARELDLAGDETAKSAAQKRLFEVYLALTSVAVRSELWGLADHALEQAERLGLGGTEPEIRAARAELGQRRDAPEIENRQAIERLFAEAASGALDEPPRYENALFEVVGRRREQTVRLLTERLDEITRRIHEVAKERLATTETPTVEEQTEGEGTIEGLPAALERWANRAPGEALARSDADLVRRAGRRLRRRVSRERSVDAPRPRELYLLALDQARLVGHEAVARLCCEALGRLGMPELAHDALARYLFAELDQQRAARAAIALILLRTDEDEATLELIRTRARRFAAAGPFGPLVERYGVVARPRAEARPASELELRSVKTADDAIANGRAFLGDSRVDQAVTAFEKAVRLDPGRAEAWRLLASARVAHDQPVQALEATRRAIELEPEDPYARTLAARILIRMSRIDEALAALTETIALDPPIAEPWLLRARILRHRGEHEAALQGLDGALAIAPDSPSLRFERARLRDALGRKDAAQRDLERAVELDPFFAKAWTHLAIQRLEADDTLGAQNAATRAIDVDPTLPHGFSVRAAARLAFGDPLGAFGDATRAIEIDEHYGPGFRERGFARLHLRRYSEAIRDFDRALAADPEDAMAHFGRGHARFNCQEIEGAIEDLDTFLELAPDHPRAEEARRNLRTLRAGD